MRSKDAHRSFLIVVASAGILLAVLGLVVGFKIGFYLGSHGTWAGLPYPEKYQVQEGETLTSLTSRLDVPPDGTLSRKCIRSNLASRFGDSFEKHRHPILEEGTGTFPFWFNDANRRTLVVYLVDEKDRVLASTLLELVYFHDHSRLVPSP